MSRISLAEKAHQIITRHLFPGDTAIDATLGNGHDTRFLARRVGPNGHVFGFDIQQQAILSTTKRLSNLSLLSQVVLTRACHADMAAIVPRHFHRQVQTVMFNLGYLPGADKSMITQPKTTLAALNAAVGLLAGKGLLTVVAYPGHSGGDVEARSVFDWLNQLDQQRFTISTLYSDNNPIAPRLHLVEKH